jgi:hypothetical protein
MWDRSCRVVIPTRPCPKPTCSDGEVLAINIVRHLIGRRGESTFLEEVRTNWPGLFPHLPVQSELNRRVRWLWGATELIRQERIAAIPADTWGQVDTSALPVKHPSRHRGAEGNWCGPNDLVPGFGRDAAHAEWFYGFRLAVVTDQLELARHSARTFWGLLTRTAGAILGHTLLTLHYA